MNSSSQGFPVLVSRPRPRRHSTVGKLNLGDTIRGLTGPVPYNENDQLKTKSRQNSVVVTEPQSKNGSYKASLRNAVTSYSDLRSKHIWLPMLWIVLPVYSLYFLSRDRSSNNPLHMFVAVSYRIDDTDMYGKGVKDLCFVFYYMLVFTLIREFVMDMLIRPIAMRQASLNSHHKLKRVMEQVFYVIYYGISGPFGLYIMYRSDLWFFRTDTLYRTYPDLNNQFLFKCFYLCQAAFWAQQACVLVLQLEKPRKDFKELVFHHIVTLLLIWSSYVFHFAKMGLPVYVSMDISDCLLALSKTFNYMDSYYTPLVFIIFMFGWIYLRHVVNMRILWSVLTEFRTEGNYVLNFATQQYKCWISQIIVFVLLLALQLVNLYWFGLILRILYRLIAYGIQRDERSEVSSEEEEEEEEGEEQEEDNLKVD